MTKKFFFMASMSANLQGRPLVSFNVVTAIPTRNVGAAALNHIQEAGASMVRAQEIEFDDLVIQNLMFLGEMTDEEFLAGTQPRDVAETDVNLEGAAAEAGALAAEADATATAEDAIAAEVDQAPAGQVLEPKLELAVDNSTINQTNDVSNLDAQALEATPVDDVTTADVKTED